METMRFNREVVARLSPFEPSLAIAHALANVATDWRDASRMLA